MRFFGAPKLPSAPVARIEKPAATIKRLTADIAATAEEHTARYGNKWIGSRCGDWACVATDGHRALLVRDADGLPKRVKPWKINKLPKPNDPHAVFSDPEMLNGLRRLAQMTKDEKLRSVKFTVQPQAGQIVMNIKTCECQGDETYPCESPIPMQFALDPDFVMPLMGTWPLRLYFTDDASPVIFIPATRRREFMYVVMPIKI